MRQFILAFLMVVVIAGVPAAAQDGAESVVNEIQTAYDRFEYDEADRMGRDALRRYNDFTVEQLTEIHMILGLVAYDRGDFRESERQFISALQLTPDLELDPLQISPKIVTYFNEIRSEIATGGDVLDSVAIRYVVRRDPRADAAARSMVLPGWGQFYKGHRTKGWVISALFGATAAGAVGAHLKRRDAKAAYEDADPDLVEDRYDAFNRWHKARSGLIQGAAVIWAVGYVDALLTDAAFGDDQKRLALRTSPHSLSVTLRF